MNRTYEYRLYPRHRERHLLEHMLEQGCEVYNLALQQCKAVYQATGEREGGLAQWKLFSAVA